MYLTENTKKGIVAIFGIFMCLFSQALSIPNTMIPIADISVSLILKNLWNGGKIINQKQKNLYIGSKRVNKTRIKKNLLPL